MDGDRANSRWYVVACAIAIELTIASIGHTQDQPPTGAPTAALPASMPALPVAQPSATTPAMRYDAALADIGVRNEVLGWAVGDRGVIWHTDDAGATWKQQASPVSCHLSAVFFIDGRRGWIVGGECRPGTAGSNGIFRRTDDGGTTWTQIPRILLPRLAGVKFSIAITASPSATVPPSRLPAFRYARRRQYVAVAADGSILRLAHRRLS